MNFLDRMIEFAESLRNNNIPFEWKVYGDDSEVITTNIAYSPLTECNLCVDKQENCICKKEEEKEMNKILQLYVERKEKEIKEKYDSLVEKEYNEIEYIQVYNDLVNAFEGALKELYEDETNVGSKYLRDSALTENAYKYKLMEANIKHEIRKKYADEEQKECEELNKMVEEVETMLSLADEGNGNIDKYKVEDILKNYGIIDENLKIQA